MKNSLKIVMLFFAVAALNSCVSVRVTSDYDENVDFKSYKTFAFYKTGIDKAEINDIDKRRILRAIEAELVAKGYKKSPQPDFLVSIFTKSRERVNIYNNGYGPWGYGWGWTPFYLNNLNAVSTSTEGQLFVDFIDANKKELIWQGHGTGYLTQNTSKKQERIREFVYHVIQKFPPELKQ